ncbi:MAG: pilin [Metallibacterium scheffleri]|uniref:pilin n=1 Tax=Metallibacterium scheffleri TaxID=993689 RepID=UPI0026EFCD2F|nr:pilin [Metallibacterium scheffleri]MCK9365708.1 pilin [Metallibacterium scheffleri]
MRRFVLPLAGLLTLLSATALSAPPAASTAAPAAAVIKGPEINPQELHIALSSLLLAATKMAIEDAIKRGKAPDSNAAAHVGEPDYLTSNEISSITVHKGGVLEVHFTSAVSPDLTGVWLTPTRAGDSVKWSCISHDIPQITDVESYCSYQSKAH